MEHGYNKVLVESNCMCVVEMLTTAVLLSHVDYFLFKECRALLSTLECEFKVKHIGRTSNEAADHLAKAGVKF